MTEHRYIAVEGPIGVGKTSFARTLAEHLTAHIILEKSEENPFLADFYKNRSKFALQTQLFFLVSRYQQQTKLVSHDLFMQRIVTDYTFDKDRLFAQINLDEKEMFLYDKIAEMLGRTLPQPDLVIYLQASTENLVTRIRKRAVSYERNIDIGYLHDLNEAYNSYFFNYDKGPLLVVKTDEIDFVENKEDLADLLTQISKPIKGTHYYVPPGRSFL
ncbi:MAG: deoxynucleoside kinase [candidate division Zixibacteria bacterium]|nr:deoxynucleoside kinase [candidate division Zixibacteria bacterium]MBU1469506.1 deoxynucleoside kinase [candidate division Zixibacteria bacterium]MBU2624922.1 deoxynucleoside kinase [candidate division Zixibacteria bacterium]